MPRRSAKQVGIAESQGTAAPDERPKHRQPGTKEHLGDSPYAGAPYTPESAAEVAQTATASKSTSRSSASGE